MNCYLFASPPPRVFFTGLGAGLLIVALLIITFLRRPTQPKWRRRIALAGLALVAGPLLGAALGGLSLIFGSIHPLDRVLVLQSLTLVGAIAGAIGALMIATLAGRGRGAASKPAENDEGEQRR